MNDETEQPTIPRTIHRSRVPIDVEHLRALILAGTETLAVLERAS